MTAVVASDVDRSDDPTVVEYAIREVMKGKSPAVAAKTTAKKLSGGQNMMIGPGVTIIDEAKLETAIWDRFAAIAKNGMSKYGMSIEDAAGSAIQHFYGFNNVEANEKKYLKSVLAALARNGISGATEAAVTTKLTTKNKFDIARTLRTAANALTQNAVSAKTVAVAEAYKKTRDIAAEASGKLQDLMDLLATAAHAKEATAYDKERFKILRQQVEKADELVFNIGTGILDVE